MAAPIADRFTAPQQVPQSSSTAPHRGREDTRDGGHALETGVLLLLAGGTAASGWIAPSPAQAEPLQVVVPEPAELEIGGSTPDAPQISRSAPDAPQSSGGDMAEPQPVEAGIAAPETGTQDSPGPSPLTPLWSSTEPSAGSTSSTGAAPSEPAGPSDPSTAPPGGASALGLIAVSAAGPERIQDRLAQGTLTVRSGESLWSLTSDLLGPHASAEEIARSWPQLWKANADQVRDPDRILAGTVLLVPDSLLPEH